MKPKISFFIPFITAWVLLFSLTAQESPLSPGDLRLKFETEVRIARRSLDEFNEKYTEHLEKQKAVYQSNGELKGVLAVEEELKSFKNSPSENLSSFRDLQRLQKIYRDQRPDVEEKVATMELKLATSYKETAADLAKQLTKAGKIELAKRALAESERLTKIESELKKAIAERAESRRNSSRLSTSAEDDLKRRILGKRYSFTGKVLKRKIVIEFQSRIVHWYEPNGTRLEMKYKVGKDRQILITKKDGYTFQVKLDRNLNGGVIKSTVGTYDLSLETD